MDYLQEIYGVGPVLAKELINKFIELGYDELLFDQSSPNRLSRSKLFALLRKSAIYKTLPANAQAYLKYKPNSAIPREVIAILDKELHAHAPHLKFVLAGSYRRGKPTCNDADIVVRTTRTTNRDVPIIEKFAAACHLSDSIEMLEPYAHGNDIISVMFRVVTQHGGRRYTIKSDIFITNPEEFIYMLLFATGSGSFNIVMRALAKRNNMLLNQRGLFTRDGVRIPLTTERQIFDKIGMTFRKPEKREMQFIRT